MSAFIQITDGLSIPRGNFGFILERAGHQKLQQRCVELEQTLKLDYDSFAHKYRLTLEEFALAEETAKRIAASGMRYNEQTTRRRITQEIKADGGSGYSNILVELCLSSENVARIEQLLLKGYLSPAAWNQRVFKEELETHVRTLFRFGSQNSHSGEKSDDLLPSNDVCKDYLRKLHALLAAYYAYEEKFDGGRIPFGDYYPVPKKLCREYGLELPDKKYYFVREGEGGLEHYIFTNADSDSGDAQRRDIETIHRLWMENIDSPQNVLPNAGFVANKNGKDYRYWISPLPSFPQSLTDDYIQSLSCEDRLQIVRGIIRGVASMHRSDPPYYHRAISPSSFIVCRVRNRLKVMLVNFDCAKDTDEDAAYTVLYAVSSKLAKSEAPELLFAPELLAMNETESTGEPDWAAVDIFALGKTILKTLTNSYSVPHDKPENISTDAYGLICDMCSPDPKQRPDIDTVLLAF